MCPVSARDVDPVRSAHSLLQTATHNDTQLQGKNKLLYLNDTRFGHFSYTVEIKPFSVFRRECEVIIHERR